MKKFPLILIGGGGHCRSCIDVIELEDKYAIQGIIDENGKLGQTILDYPVIGNDSILMDLIDKENYFLITIGQIKSAAIRVRLFEQLKRAKAKLATIVSPKATVSRYAQISDGTIVMHGVQVNAGAIVGNNVILNTNCLIEHDVLIGDHVHVSTHAVLNGGVNVADECFIGSNSVIGHNRHLKERIVVGAGAVVISDIEMPGTYVGNPAKIISQ